MTDPNEIVSTPSAHGFSAPPYGASDRPDLGTDVIGPSGSDSESGWILDMVSSAGILDGF